MNRTRNSIKNSFWSIASKIVTLFLPFFSRTMIIEVLGVEYLGLGSLFSSVLRILNMAELGVGAAIVYSMYKPIAENDDELVCALLNTYKHVYRFIGFAVLSLGVLLLPFLPKLINGTVPKDINIYSIYLIYLGNSVVSYWLFAYKSSILNACQRNDIISKVNIVMNVLLYGTQIVLLLLYQSYYFYAMVFPIISITGNVVTAICATKAYPYYFCKGSIPRYLRKDITKRVTGLMLDKVAMASRNAFDSVIISAFLGLQTVAMYNNYYYISSAVSGLLTSAVAAVLPSIGNSIVTESLEKNENDMRSISFFYMTVSGVCFCFFLNLYQPFMKLWVGADLLFPVWTMVAFSLYFLVEKSENILGNYYDAAGMWWNGRWKGLIEASCNLLLNIILCKLLGAFGVVIATLISMIFVGIPITAHYLYKFYYKKSSSEYLKEHYCTLLKLTFIGFATLCTGMMFPDGDTMLATILCMFFRCISSFAVFVIIFYATFSKSQQYVNAKKWARIHFPRR